ncbi:hypothetical protein Dsin_001404 [Dipteronia sinensis]|uniref:Proteasome subunit alpha type n=1 Tax=Dipteronia sinensis TaxID=43782 RepID=A0AAE0EIB2_9ROSI|nr:hypothetical protein Dsin_001404 [Dipteronia sinensis]
MARYDSAFTVFSPDGHLFQVEYALEAFRNGNAVCGSNIFILGVEKKTTAKLQDSRYWIHFFTNLCQIFYITHYIAGLQQKYTQSGSVRRLSTLIVGFDPYTGTSSIYHIDPSGTFSAWKANATGRNSNSIQEFLEKNYKETYGQETVKLAIRALLEVVGSGGKNKEVDVITKDDRPKQLEEVEIDAIVTEIEEEKAAAKDAKKGPPKET